MQASMDMAEGGFLITTALKETWREDVLCVFLGEWALDYASRKVLGQKAEIVPFHWADYAKLEKDYLYLDNLYEKLLSALTSQLNSYHGVNLPERYWRIYLGPWLAIFTQIFFERWESVNKALDMYKISATAVLDIPVDQMIPPDMLMFSKMMTTDEWNHYLFSIILNEVAGDITVEHRQIVTVCDTYASVRQDDGEQFQQKAIGVIKKVLNLLTRRNKVFIGSSYLGFSNDLRLSLKLAQFPSAFRSIEVKEVKPDIELRNKLNFSFNPENDFEKKLKSIIFLHMPICMLEGYQVVKEMIHHLPYPSAPRVIFTSNFLAYDSMAMAYTAKHVSEGCKLVHGQHGGYGIPAFMYAELHERKIADVFLSWGWSDAVTQNIEPVGMLNPVGNYERKKRRVPSDLLLVRGLWPRYTFRIDSGVGLSLNDAIEDCLSFAAQLTDDIRDNSLLVRLYHRDYGFEEHYRWREKFPKVRIDEGKKSIADLVSASRLVIYTYNIGTGYLEYMNANIPTIAFWDMRASPVRKEAGPYFDALRHVGIFHDTPESAAKHVQTIWYDVEEWWFSQQVQKAKDDFCFHFARKNENIVTDICQIIKKQLNKV